MLTKSDVRRIRDLRERKHRTEAGQFVVEGEKVVAELMAAGFPFAEVFATEEFTPPPRLAVQTVSREEMARISHFPTPSPVLAVGRMEEKPWRPGEIDRGLTLALDGVQDPGNVGTMLRIADWFGTARVLLSGDCADRFGQKAIQASMGSFARVAAHTVENLAEALAGAKVPVLGCALEGENIAEVAPLADGVVVIGSEGRGLSPEVRRCVTRMVTIPRRGRAESLNAAVAAGIVLQRLS